MWICRRYSAAAGRSIHTYHTGDAGGGHAHSTLKIAGEKYPASSTNLTRSFTVNTLEEHPGMMICHHLDSSCPRRCCIC